MQRLTIKTSTIFIAKKGKTRVFHSVNEVPPRLRKELEDSTNSFNSATILIADSRGREEIVRALNGLPSSLRSRLAHSLSPRTPDVPVQVIGRGEKVLVFLRRRWLELLVPGVVGAAIWLAFNFR